MSGRPAVLAMTIAEVFLLLMFVVWLAGTVDSANGPGTLDAVVLKQKLEEREKELAKALATAKDQDATIQALRRMLNSPSVSIGDLTSAFTAKMNEAKRGKRTCASDNVLVSVEATNGVMTASLVTHDAVALKWFRGRLGDVPLGLPIDETLWPQLFEATRAWYQAQDCRFDYRLVYKSSEDYHAAREQFEALYYPAGIRRQ
jgi:hypothetical protein